MCLSANCLYIISILPFCQHLFCKISKNSRLFHFLFMGKIRLPSFYSDWYKKRAPIGCSLCGFSLSVMQQRTFPQFAWPLFAQRRVFPYLPSWWSGWRRKLAAVYRFARSPAWQPCCRRSPVYGIPVPALPVRLQRFWRRCTAWAWACSFSWHCPDRCR